jgi:hypothetical protein
LPGSPRITATQHQTHITAEARKITSDAWMNLAGIWNMRRTGTVTCTVTRMPKTMINKIRQQEM